MTRIQKTAVLVTLALVLLSSGVALWRVNTRPAAPTPTPAPVPPAEDEPVLDPPPPDPRLTFETVFRNVRPDVQYTGDARCAGCHDGICNSYHAHPMGRSAFAVAAAPPLERYEAGANNPFFASGYELRVVRDAGTVQHRVAVKGSAGAALPEYAVPADVAIGSGTRGRSYLSVEQGAAWQSPVSWFSEENRWNVSPGFDLGSGGRRAIVPGCLFCHTDRVEPLPGALNRYREPLLQGQGAIGCERCHGPGALHVAERAAGRPPAKIDTSIVNPKHLPPALQSAVCEQCHLQGAERVARPGRSEFEFRPGMPFDLFVTTFVRHPDLAEPHRSVGQYEQLELSRCAPAGGGRLLCTHCHDPHAVPAAADRDRYFRDRCNRCHESKGCVAPAADRAARGDSCVACHMPRSGSTSIAHASVTDHRVARRPAPAPPRGLRPGTEPLVPFRPGAAGDGERELGIALARLSGRLPPGGAAPAVGRFARDRLTAALGARRGDPDAWLAMSVARAACGEYDEWLTAADRAARLNPGSEAALAQVADAALAVGKYERAEAAAGALVALSPRSVDYLVTRATARAALNRWDEAEADCRAALAVHPLHPRVRLLLGVCLHKRGDPAAGQKEADAAVALATNPRQQSALREWYQRETK